MIMHGIVKTKPILMERFVSLIVVLICAGFLAPRPVWGASLVKWNGKGAQAQWHEAKNWSGNLLPTANDTAVFDATSVQDCYILSAVKVAKIVVSPAYSGKVVQGANVTVSGDFIQAAGTWDLSARDPVVLAVGGDFVKTGGSMSGFYGMGGGTLHLTGGGKLVAQGKTEFRNLICAVANQTTSSTGELALSGTLTVGPGTLRGDGEFSLQGGGGKTTLKNISARIQGVSITVMPYGGRGQAYISGGSYPTLIVRPNKANDRAVLSGDIICKNLVISHNTLGAVSLDTKGHSITANSITVEAGLKCKGSKISCKGNVVIDATGVIDVPPTGWAVQGKLKNLGTVNPDLGGKAAVKKKEPIAQEDVQKGVGAVVEGKFHALSIGVVKVSRGVKPCLEPLSYPHRQEIRLKLDISGVGKLPPGAFLDLSVAAPDGGKAIVKQRMAEQLDADKVKVALNVGNLQAGKYDLRVSVKDKNAKELGLVVVEVTWPGALSWPNVGPGARTLNNLVTELINVDNPAAREFTFTNPREGWIFVSSTAELKGQGKIRLSLTPASSIEPIIVHGPGSAPVLEAMRFLPPGEHRLKVAAEGKSVLKKLIVRVVPELIYNEYGVGPRMKMYGEVSGAPAYLREYNFTWDFVKKRHMLQNYNAIIGGGKEENAYKEWKQQGKKWFTHTSLPYGDKDTPLTTESAYNYWTREPGFNNPMLDGVFADEFWGGDKPEYIPWTAAVKKIRANKQFKGKKFNAYCHQLFWAEFSRNFVTTLMDAGYTVARECYLTEQTTEDKADAFLRSVKYLTEIREWERVIPGSIKHMILTLASNSTPMETLDTCPSVNFKVWLDKQFNLAANEPVFWGLYGVTVYHNYGADEEIIRWLSRLNRHYWIEGNTEMLSKDPYILPHLRNPDFENGAEGWTLSPAEKGSMAPRTVDELGWLQGRYPRSDIGNTCLWTKRNAKRPNRFSQEIKDLEPGQLYSLKMYTADHSEIVRGKSEKTEHVLSIKLENAEFLPDKWLHCIFPNYGYGYTGKFNRKNKLWMNYHVRVFRAKSNTAMLTISDWASDKAPGAPAGQELVYNFIQVQPYFEE